MEAASAGGSVGAMECLPEEVASLLAMALPHESLVALGRTSCRWRRIALDPIAWRALHQRRWRFPVLETQPPAGGWRGDFARRHRLDLRVVPLLRRLLEPHARQAAWNEVQMLGMEVYDAVVEAARGGVEEPVREEAWKVLHALNQGVVRREWEQLQLRARAVEADPVASSHPLPVEEGAILLVRWYLSGEELLEPQLAAPAVEAQLDQLANRLRARLPSGFGSREAVVCLSELLFVSEGWSGNQRHYYDPRNSLLNHVLNSRTGIPISLSVVFGAVCRRVGVELDMIGMPGHFLLATKPTPDSPRVFVDAFHGGQLLGVEECEQIVGSYGIGWSEQMVAPVPVSEVWSRMVRNLLNCCQRVRDLQQAKSVQLLMMRATDGELRLDPLGSLPLRPLPYPSELEQPPASGLPNAPPESPLLQQMLQSLLNMQQQQTTEHT